MEKYIDYDVIIVGSGFSGSILANHFASINKKVLIIEKRDNIAGNMYDYIESNGVLTHKFGPHICYFQKESTLKYLENFSEFVPYHHQVWAKIDDKTVPLPINFNSIDILFEKEAEKHKNNIMSEFPNIKNISINQLLKSNKNNELGDFLYEKVFFNYSSKMWGFDPKELDSFVLDRIPIKTNYDNNHFTTPIQVMPKNGYTFLFKKMLDSNNINIIYNTKANQIIEFKENNIFIEDIPYKGLLFYSGPIDEAFKYKFGKLPWRSLDIKIENINQEYIQEYPVINFPDDKVKTRITDMKRLNCQNLNSSSTIKITEIPGEYVETSEIYNERYYPYPRKQEQNIYLKYKTLADQYKNVYFIGRLGEYKYYNMENTIQKTLELIDSLTK